MTNNSKQDVCYQCGKPRIMTKQYTEYINGSPVVTTESVCSDPKCQENTMDVLEKERLKRNYSITNRRHSGFTSKQN